MGKKLRDTGDYSDQHLRYLLARHREALVREARQLEAVRAAARASIVKFNKLITARRLQSSSNADGMGVNEAKSSTLPLGSSKSNQLYLPFD